MRKATSIFFIGVLSIASMVASSDVIRFIPAAASAPGVGDSFFVTDVRIFNPDPDETITVHLAFLVRGENNTGASEVPVEVPPRGSVALDDILATVFDIEGAGGIRLRSDRLFHASSRTYNLGGDAGTFGQFIPGSSPEEALTNGILLSVTNDPAAVGSRANVGFANPTSGSVTVEVRVFDNETDELLGSRNRNLPPLAVQQINDVFAWVGFSDRVTVNATVEFEATAPVLAYASVIDNTSDDPIYVLPSADAGSSGDGNNAPVATILAPTGDLVIEAGGEVSFGGSVFDPDGDLVTFEWDFGDGMSSTELNPGAHTFSDPGTYEVRFTATDELGLESYAPATRTVEVTEVQTTLQAVQELIFTPRCAVPGCHHGSSPPAGLNLEEGQAHSNIVNVASLQQPSKDLIEPFSPEDSYLWLKVTDDPSIAGIRMPPPGSGPRLDQELLDLLEAWIEDGALND
jgi:hypothetical protein